jgi:hypothetical protein
MDSVRLSEESEVRLRVQQGESPAEIALDVGVATMTITAYLVPDPQPAPAYQNLKTGRLQPLRYRYEWVALDHGRVCHGSACLRPLPRSIPKACRVEPY